MTDQPEHARLSPSSADGWSVCSDYPNANEGLPDDTTEYAAEGTAAHLVSDLCLTLGFEPHHFVGDTFKVDGFEIEFDEGMADALLPGIEQIRELEHQGGVFFGEHKVDCSAWLGPGQFGTLDRGVILVRPDSVLVVISDLKFGAGIPVSPVQNKQCQIYLISFWTSVVVPWLEARRLSHLPPEFLIIIDQPRCSGGGGEWKVTLDELMAFGEWIKERAAVANGPNTTRVASAKGCYWCRRRKQPPEQEGALSGCAAYDQFNLDLLGLEFDDLDDGDAEPVLPGINRLSAERRAYIVQHAKLLEKWIEQVHADCLADTMRNGPTAGLKAVAGRKNPDTFPDKKAAEAALVPILGEKSFTKKLILPSQVSKLVTPEVWETLAPVIKVGIRKPVLVPEADARPAINAADDFDDLND